MEDLITIKRNLSDKKEESMTIDEAQRLEEEEKASFFMKLENGSWALIDKVFPKDEW